MNDLKVVDQLSEDKIVVQLVPRERRGQTLKIAHDYIEIAGGTLLSCEPFYIDKPLYGAAKSCCSNIISINTSVQVPIRAAQQVLLPLLNEHKYLQSLHIADREHTEDDKYFAQKDLSEPRYRKGDKYAAYSYCDQKIHYYKDGISMVAILMQGESVFNHVTLEFYNKFCKKD